MNTEKLRKDCENISDIFRFYSGIDNYLHQTIMFVADVILDERGRIFSASLMKGEFLQLECDGS